ncbi:MAG: methyltransferase domain-containing protein [Xenococcaceae cyanobacterium]
MDKQITNYYQHNQQIQNHYRQLAQNYDDLWTYSPDFIKFIAKNIIEQLNLQFTDKLADLGCGTGLFAKEISHQIKLQYPIVCVDSSPEMLEQIPLNDTYQPREMEAMDFASQGDIFDKIFIKEMIHHISDKPKLIANLFNRLNPGGILLLILLPPTIEYPLFESAKKSYEELQPHYRELEDIFEPVGFQTEVSFVKYPLSLDKDKYFKMVENRYMSLLSMFNDEEISQGIKEMKEKYLEQLTLDFNDVFVFIKGQK